MSEKRSFWTWLTIIYFAVGFVSLSLMATIDNQLALHVALYWGLIMPGLVLMTLGTNVLQAAPAKFVEALGWLWLAVVVGFIAITNNPAIAATL